MAHGSLKRLASPKSALTVGFVLVSAGAIVGCPVYRNSGGYGCYSSFDCPIGYACTFDGYCVNVGGSAGSAGASPGAGGVLGSGGSRDSGADTVLADAGGPTDDASLDGQGTDAEEASAGDAGPSAVYCGNPNDCAASETCTSDGTCQAGDCMTHACINQFQCAVAPAPLSGLSCVRGDSRACAADRECVTGQKCVDGICTAFSELCTDRAQCPSGSVCVEGQCIAACTTDGQCPAGFACQTALGVCTAAAKPCSRTSECGGSDVVCVNGACVPRCTARGACGDASGVCVDNGCVPSRRLVSQCIGDGTPAGCPVGQICLHHHCYVSCQAPNLDACDARPSTPICKTVTLGATSYAVCGTVETLGSACDPSAGAACPSGTCIDGFCR
jgi:hypothetical protein